MASWSALVARANAGGNRLAVIGGRLEDDNVSIHAEMKRMSGGRVLIFPTASAEPKSVGEETAQAFRTHGITAEVALLTEENARIAAFDPALIARIMDFGSVYFTGGDQAKIVAALVQNGAETPVLTAIRAAHAAGGLVAGSSAGAAMMSHPMLLGGTSLEAVIHGVTTDPERPGLLIGDGLGFFPFGMLDQHFIKRGRLGRLVVAMNSAGISRGFGIDENTALLVEGDVAQVRGEYGVMMIDLGNGTTDPDGHAFRDFRLSYVDDGDWIDLKRFKAVPGPGKRRVRLREMAYRAPINSRRNVFGAYALYDLMARLVLGEPAAYCTDSAEAFDARSGVNVTVALERKHRSSSAHISTPDSGLRMTALNFRCSLIGERLSPSRIADRAGRRNWTYGAQPVPDARMILLGSSPLDSAAEMMATVRAHVPTGPIGVIAAASAEAARTADKHVRMLDKLGMEGIDLGVTIDSVEFVAQDQARLDQIAEMPAILLCGGNQIRLVETMLHRGEESAVLRAIARAHARGAVLIAASGGASALSGVMIAGGSAREALRYGVASDLGHPGLVIQEGIGLFGGGIIDQNLISSNRLGRLVVACAEEGERYGIGICEDSAVVTSESGNRLEARGKHGFVLIEVDPHNLVLQSDSFIANGIRLTLLGPGDSVDLSSATVRRASPSQTSPTLLRELVSKLAREVGVSPKMNGEGSVGSRGARMRFQDIDATTAVLDLESPRDEND